MAFSETQRLKPVHHSSVPVEGISVQIDQVNPAEWEQYLDLFEDANLYQTRAYGAVRWGENSLSHVVLKQSGDPVAMAQLRLVRPNKLKLGIAYLRWGPMCHRKHADLRPEVVRAMGAALEKEYVRKRGLFLRILPNAFKETERAAVFQAAFENYRSEPFGPGDSYRTFMLDLADPLPELRKRLDQKWRNQLNRAEKNGLRIVEGDSEAEFRVMIKLFNEMWARKQFNQTSDINEFERMQCSLPEGRRMRVFLCEHEGVPVSGLLATAMGNCGIYLFGGTSDQGLQLKGSYLLQWRMIQWLKENGIRYYNLNGINPETNPGVYHFKKGLSGEDSLYLEPLWACTNPLSAAFARVGFKMKGRLTRALTKVLKKRP